MGLYVLVLVILPDHQIEYYSDDGQDAQAVQQETPAPHTPPSFGFRLFTALRSEKIGDGRKEAGHKTQHDGDLADPPR